MNVSRNRFWTTVVERTFNDPYVRPIVQTEGHISNIDASLPPLRHRDGPELKKHYEAARAHITKDYGFWKKTGEMVLVQFEKYCMQDNRNNGELTAIGKIFLIMFFIYRCGTMDEFGDVLYFTL